jgi:hypothetical protein
LKMEGVDPPIFLTVLSLTHTIHDVLLVQHHER